MGKKILAAFLLLLLFALPALAGAEGEPAEAWEAATPTDLPCPHEHIRTTIYFFDSPNYTPLSPASHRVNGPAAVETVCEDCGALLSSETAGDAEEVRPHSMKKGVCALCGYRQKAAEEGTKDNPLPRPAPGERTLSAQPEGGGLYTLSLSRQDLKALSNARVRTVLIRGRTGRTLVALDVAEIRKEAEEAEASVSLEMAEQEDGSCFAGLFLVNEARKARPRSKSIALRFYREKAGELRFSVVASDTDSMTEADAAWNDDGYWSVAYVDEGTYFPLDK